MFALARIIFSIVLMLFDPPTARVYDDIAFVHMCCACSFVSMLGTRVAIRNGGQPPVAVKSAETCYAMHTRVRIHTYSVQIRIRIRNARIYENDLCYLVY